MSRVRYRAEPGWEEKLRAQPEMSKGMQQRAKVVAATAKSIAPQGPTGAYRKLIRAVRGGRVHAYDFAWHWVEFGSVHQPPLGVLRRAVILTGLRFKPNPKA